MRSFSSHVTVPGKPAEARTLALEKLGGPLSKAGYKLTEQTPSGLSFRRKPLLGGPFWLFRGQPTATITMTFEEQGNQTRMVVAGEAPRRLARQFEQLR